MPDYREIYFNYTAVKANREHARLPIVWEIELSVGPTDYDFRACDTETGQTIPWTTMSAHYPTVRERCRKRVEYLRAKEATA